jgi:hypothetical protein
VFPPDALDRLRRFGAEIDGVAPGALAGLYAVGSLALGDYVPTLSNFDVLAVSETAWPTDQLRASGRAGQHLAGSHRAGIGPSHRPARVGYLTWADLAEGPTGAGACYEGRGAVPATELLNPLTWQVMRTAAVCVRGPEYPDLWSGDLRGWAASRLTGYWAKWLPGADRHPGSLWHREATTEPVLEATRLVVALRSGRVVSKLEAGTSAVDSGPSRGQRILKDAVGHRSGARTSMYWGPFERKHDALAHIRACVEEAQRS